MNLSIPTLPAEEVAAMHGISDITLSSPRIRLKQAKLMAAEIEQDVDTFTRKTVTKDVSAQFVSELFRGSLKGSSATAVATAAAMQQQSGGGVVDGDDASVPLSSGRK